MDWFRSWHGAPTDTKFLVIAKRANVAPGMVSAVYWALLDHASQNTPRGCVDGFDAEAYAAWAGWEESDVTAIVAAFVVKGTIKDGYLAAWDKRQPKREDDSRPRVAAFRERERALQNLVTQSNTDVTQGNAPDKIREDSETETEREPDPDPVGAAAAAWENAGQRLTATIADLIVAEVNDWQQDGHPEYVAQAIEVAAKANKLSWRYVEGILNRCRKEGTAPKGKTNGKHGADDAARLEDWHNAMQWGLENSPLAAKAAEIAKAYDA